MIPYTNRELSWLEFNQRVLDLSKREDLPLLERLKFLAISGSNLDEFYQVRIGGLSEQQRKGDTSIDPSGMTITEQLFKTSSRARDMMAEQYRIWASLSPDLYNAGLQIKKVEKFSGEGQQHLREKFIEEVLPILTPIALQYEESMVSILALQLCLVCKLEDTALNTRHALIPIPKNLSRFQTIRETPEEREMITLEDLIETYLSEIFPDETILDSTIFRLTKNSDIVLEDDEAVDLAGEMKEVLSRRNFGNAVRVEVVKGSSKELVDIILTQTRASKSHLIELPGPLGLSDFFSLSVIPGFEKHKFAPWKTRDSSHFDPEKSIFDTLDEKSVLLIHPFESFEPVVRMLEEASDDPNTLAIKQVLYRTASKSGIIDALKKAAINGKQVTVLIELKARFDEARNLIRAEELRKAGVQVIYGVKGYKTHAKATLIIRKTNSGIKRYVHLGTGNYNETTANLYTDMSYLSSQPQMGADTSLFFNMLTGHSKMTSFQKLRPAPTLMKSHLLQLIKSEKEQAKQGQKARILGKMNSLQDPDIIKALYKASQAGVEIKLNVRGICCLKPGIKDLSENIQVVSIIDRYLEHTRTFAFEHTGDHKVFISSADWMVRNLEKRLELLIPIEGEKHKRRIIKYLEACFKDNTNSYSINPDGTSSPITVAEGKSRFQFQKHLHETISSLNSPEDVHSFQPHSSNR